MEIAALRSDEDLRRYVAFAEEVCGDTPAWVPPDAHHLAEQLAGRAFGGAHARIQPFWAEEAGRILATCTAVVDDLFNRHWQDAVGHVLFFEALRPRRPPPGPVLEAACTWLRQQGCPARSGRLSLRLAAAAHARRL